MLQVSRVSVPFKIWGSFTLRHVILWSTKIIKSTLQTCFANMWNQLQDPAPHLFSSLSLCQHPSRCFFEARPKWVSLQYHPSTFDYTFFYRWLAAFDVHPGTSCRRGIWAKNNLFVLCDGVFDGFFKLFLCFHTVSTGCIQLFCKF